MRKGAKTQRARELRKVLTDAERRVWFLLRRNLLNDFRFRRQHPIGPYVGDFVCLEARLVIEVDGSQHLDSDYDQVRDAYIRRSGFRILRVWNNAVFERMDEVLAAILDALNASEAMPPSGLRPPSPASQGKEQLDRANAVASPAAQGKEKRRVAR